MPSQINNKPTHLQSFNYTSFYHDDSYYSAFSNFFKLSFNKEDGSLDLVLVVDIALVAVLEFTDAYIISSLTDARARSNYLFKAYPLLWGIGAAKDYLYSDITTQHMTPNILNNFKNLWYEKNEYNNNITNEDIEILSNYNAEAGTASYQFGNVLRGALSSSTKIIASVIKAFKGSAKESVFIIGYVLVMGG